MKYNPDLAMPANPTVDFFKEHEFEIIACCMRLQPDTKGLSIDQTREIRYRAMNIIAQEYEFGRYRHLCKTCYKNPETCGADPMIGFLDHNICYCSGYDGELSEEVVSKGLSGVEHPGK